MPKVLITGGAGFIGSRIARRFLEVDYDVTVFDTFKQYLIPHPGAEQHNLLVRLADIYESIEIIQGDALNKDYLRRSLNSVNPDVIVHMGALPLAAMAIEHTEEAFDSILSSTVNILEVMRDFDHPCTLVYASSSMVYGDFESDSVTEESPVDPKDIYGSLKVAGEFIARGYMRRYGLDVRIVRPTAVYGPFDGNRRVLFEFVTRALKGEALTIDGDGSMSLDFTYVDDTARAIFLVATRPEAQGHTFNVARGQARTLKEAVELIQTHIEGVKIQYGAVPDHVPKRGTLDITKARDLLGFEPEYDLERGIEIYIEHLRHNPI